MALCQSRDLVGVRRGGGSVEYSEEKGKERWMGANRGKKIG